MPTPDAITDFPNAHITLEEQDGSNATGFVIIGPNGQPDITGILRDPFPTTGLKIAQKETEYADQELPYVTTHQDDFSGGRGAEKFEDDKTRVADGYRIETRFGNVVFPGAQELYSSRPSGQNDHVEYWHTNSSRTSNTYTFSNTTWVARQFTAPGAGGQTIQTAFIMLDSKDTSLETVTVEIYSESGGDPNASIGTLGTITSAQQKFGIFVYVIENTTGISVTGGTDYFIVIKGASSGSTLLAYDSAASASNFRWTSDSGSSWNTLSNADLYFRIKYDGITSNQHSLFKYKGATYCYSAGNLLINGDRGVADASTSTTLVDASKSWTADDWINSVVHITNGQGSGQYRTISDNDGTSLTISAAWDTTPDTTSEYVILGSSIWQNAATGLNTTLTDIAVAGEWVYFAYGRDAVMHRYRWYNNRGAAGEDSSDETYYAEHLIATYDSTNKWWNLWGTVPFGQDYTTDIYYGQSVRKWAVPNTDVNLRRHYSQLVDPGARWEAHLDLNSANFYADSWANQLAGTVVLSSSGMLWYHNLDNAVNINVSSQSIFLECLANAGVSAGDIKLYLSDVENVGYMEPQVVVYQSSEFRRFPNATDRTGDSNDYHQSSIPILIAGTDYFYIGAPRRFNSISFTMGGSVNTTAALTLDVEYFFRRGWTDVAGDSDGTASGGTTLAQDGTYTFTMPKEWEPGVFLDTAAASGGEQEWTSSGELNDGDTSYYWIRFTPVGGNTTALNILELSVTDTGTTPGAPISINFPALTANKWTGVSLSIPNGNNMLNAVKSIGIWYDSAATTDLFINGGIKLGATDPEYISVQSEFPIRNMIAYKRDSTNDNTNPWVITDGEIFEIQQENGDTVERVLLDELKALATPDMGKGAVVNDVYLYFTMGERIQRYHEGQMENLGPDQDNGLPSGRSGVVKKLVSLPGGSVAAVVEGSSFSSILVRKSGWHEIYRTPIVNSDGTTTYMFIDDVVVQDVPSIGTRMWVVQGEDDILWFDLPMSEADAGGDYVLGPQLITPWVAMGFLDVQKRLMSLKLYTENLAATTSQIRVYYQLESGDLDVQSDWTAISTSFQTSPFQERALISDYSVAARRMRFLFLFQDFVQATIIKLRAWILGALLNLDVRYRYDLKTVIEDYPKDLNGVPDFDTSAATLQSRLDTWASSPPTVLTMRSNYTTFDNKQVILLPYSMRAEHIILNGDKQEQMTANLQLLEVV